MSHLRAGRAQLSSAIPVFLLGDVWGVLDVHQFLNTVLTLFWHADRAQLVCASGGNQGALARKERADLMGP